MTKCRVTSSMRMLIGVNVSVRLNSFLCGAVVSRRSSLLLLANAGVREYIMPLDTRRCRKRRLILHVAIAWVDRQVSTINTYFGSYYSRTHVRTQDLRVLCSSEMRYGRG